MERAWSTRELAEVAEGIERVLEAFDPSGTPLDRAVRARLEGALVVLRVLADPGRGGRLEAVLGALLHPAP
jgi:hypothetical protein